MTRHPSQSDGHEPTDEAPTETALDRVLDARASEEDHASVESDGVARTEREAWAAIEASIVRQYASDPAAADEIARRVLDADAGASRGWTARPRSAAWAAAAVLALVVGGAAWFTTSGGSGNSMTAPVAVSRDAGRYYATITASFDPEVVCDTPEKFVTYTEAALGLALTASFEGPEVLIGWDAFLGAYTDEVGPRVLLALAPSGERVVVVFEPDPPERSIVPGDGINAFEREFGSVRATELTPLDQPTVMTTVRRY